MDRNKILIMLPTYNEYNNVRNICTEILDTGVQADILFIDDNSPDGTGYVLDHLVSEYPQVHVIHRSGKMGIGSAHKCGIRYAYAQGYETLLTMDCDMLHPPSEIPELFKKFEGNDIVIGSRYVDESGLKDWNLWRKFLTKSGHMVIEMAVGMSYDSTGAFRLYRINKIPKHLFEFGGDGYSFFFESLAYLNLNNFRITEVPIHPKQRTSGQSKLNITEMFNWGIALIKLGYNIHVNKKRYTQ